VSYLICGVHGYGSAWYASLLEGTGVAGKPVTEHWNVNEEFRAHQRQPFRTYAEYLAYVRQAAATPNGVIGASIAWHQMPGAMARMRRIPGNERLTHIGMWRRALPDLKHFIFVYSDDVLGQAVARARAFQIQRWTRSKDEANGQELAYDVYDSTLLETFYWEVWAHNMAWASWFKRCGVRPFQVKYEDVMADPAGAVKQVLDLMGVELPTDYVCPEGFSVQRAGLNDEWRERAAAEFAARHIQPEHYQPE
jgi:trehalose 2-sulfotransferase